MALSDEAAKARQAAMQALVNERMKKLYGNQPIGSGTGVATPSPVRLTDGVGDGPRPVNNEAILKERLGFNDQQMAAYNRVMQSSRESMNPDLYVPNFTSQMNALNEQQRAYASQMQAQGLPQNVILANLRNSPIQQQITALGQSLMNNPEYTQARTNVTKLRDDFLKSQGKSIQDLIQPVEQPPRPVIQPAQQGIQQAQLATPVNPVDADFIKPQVNPGVAPKTPRVATARPKPEVNPGVAPKPVKPTTGLPKAPVKTKAPAPVTPTVSKPKPAVKVESAPTPSKATPTMPKAQAGKKQTAYQTGTFKTEQSSGRNQFNVQSQQAQGQQQKRVEQKQDNPQMNKGGVVKAKKSNFGSNDFRKSGTTLNVVDRRKKK